ncbi:hypothetical protein N9D31_02600 [Oligoflexaceae bacterium]|nr:hypothetical protein [Oligoflexaceae bacterium]
MGDINLNLKALMLVVLGAFYGCQEPAFTQLEAEPGEADQIARKGGSVSEFGEHGGKTEEPEDPADLPLDPANPDNPGQNPGDEILPDDLLTKDYNEIDQTFASSLVGNVTLEADIDSATLSHEFGLKRQYLEQEVRHHQIVRRQVSDSFTQGYYGVPLSENFTQTAEKRLDILAVIDNSGSMIEEQANLASKLAPLLSSVSNTDWQIAVVTTDSQDGCLRALIKKGESNTEGRFRDAVTAGVYGTGVEVGVYQAKRALAGECDTGSWVRDDSAVAVLIVSDEDNCSDGNECGDKSYKDKNYLLDYLSSIRTLGTTAKVYGLIWHPTTPLYQCPTALNRANIYADIIADTSGTWGSICDADYTNTLVNVSRDISIFLSRQFPIQNDPDQGTLRVYVDNVEMTTGFKVQGKSIVLDRAPNDGQVVRFEYYYNGKPMKDNYALSQAAYNNNIEVTVDGGVVDSSAYSISSDGKSITFASTPSERAEVKIKYFENKNLVKEFSSPGNAQVDSLKVYVSGVETSDYTYNPNRKSVFLDAAPAEGAEVRIAYSAPGNAVLAYPFTVDGAEPKELGLYDATTDRPVSFIYALGRIAINPLEFSEGRLVRAEYYNDARDETHITLAKTPIAGTLSASDGSVTCSGANITVKSNEAVVADCGFAKTSTQFVLKYKTIAKRISEFTFVTTDTAFDPEVAEWTVFINDEPTLDYERSGVTFKVTASLKYNDKVTVRAKVEK